MTTTVKFQKCVIKLQEINTDPMDGGIDIPDVGDGIILKMEVEEWFQQMISQSTMERATGDEKDGDKENQ